jgi:hypothetical protein
MHGGSVVRRRRLDVSAALVLMLVGAGALGGCASSPSPSSVPAAAMSPVPITEFRTVAGRWAGPVTGLAQRRTEGDWVQLSIAPDGTYEFGIARTIGMFAGKGQFTLEDGKLVMAGERGRATYALFEGGGRRLLRVNGVLAAGGGPVSAELSPAR